MYGLAPYGTLPYGAVPVPLGVPIIPEVTQETRELIYVVVLHLLPSDLCGARGMIGFSAISELPISAIPEALLFDETQTVIARYASRSFTTAVSDTPSQTTIDGRIKSIKAVERGLVEGEDGIFGSLIKTTLGDIELDNTDGGLDQLALGYFADGRKIELMIGATEIVRNQRAMPRFIATGEGAPSTNASIPYEIAYPTGIVVFQDTFPGSNGEAWNPAKWTAIETVGTAAATIQGNAGQISLPSGDNWFVRMDAAMDALSDFDLRFRVQLSATGPQFHSFIFRASAAWAAPIAGPGNLDDPLNGYRLSIDGDSNAFGLTSIVDGARTTLAFPSKSWGTSLWQVRLHVVGISIQARAWLDTDPEPTVWDIFVVDSDHEAGRLKLAFVNGEVAAHNVLLDNMVVETIGAAHIVPGDAFMAQLTVNDRGGGGGLLSMPSGWTLLDESSSGALYQALAYQFVTGDEIQTSTLADEFASLSLDTALDGSANWAWMWVFWDANALDANGDKAWKAWAGYEPGGGGQTPAEMGVVLHEVSGGNLKLYGRINPDTTGYGAYPYLAGMINSELSHSQLYGTWEIRARFDMAKGHKWAIWLVVTGASGAGLQEIDIVEVAHDGAPDLSLNRLFMNSHGTGVTSHVLHNGTIPASGVTGLSPHVVLANEAEWKRFHDYKIVRTETTIEWWIDGIKYMSCANYIFSPMHIMISPEIDGAWQGPPDGTTVWPTVAEIAYVRVFADEVIPAAGALARFDWFSDDAANDVITGLIHQYRYVDPDQPFAGLTSPTIGSLTSISLPTVTTTERNSLATYWVSWSDNVNALSPSGATGGNWENFGTFIGSTSGDDVANMRAGAEMVEAGTISGGSIASTATGSPPSSVSLLVGVVMRGKPVADFERDKAFSTFALVYTATAGPWSFDRDILRLKIEDLSVRLKDRLQVLTYSGGGGANGTPDMAGRSRPLLFGHCLNVPAQLVEPSWAIHQLHSGSIGEVITIYDRGIEVPFDADYPSYAALEAAAASAAIPPGTYASSIADGYIALGTPSQAVTADVKGYNEGGYVHTHAGIIRTFLRSFSPLLDEEIDLASFIDATTLQPAEIGLFLPAGDTSTVEQAIETVALSGGFFCGADRSGLYRIARLGRPGEVPHWIFDDRSILEDGVKRLEPAFGVPWRAWSVGYARNWQIQRGADLATGVSEVRRQFLEDEYRWVYRTNTQIALFHGSSSTAPPRRSLFLNEEDATAEAERLADLYRLGVGVYEVRSKNVVFSVIVGDTARVTFPRWNLNSGRSFVVTKIHDDADLSETRLLVFG